MSDDTPQIKLTPVQEGLVGGLIGSLLVGVLHLAGFVSAPAIIAGAVGAGAGSWFNARRRAKRDD